MKKINLIVFLIIFITISSCKQTPKEKPQNNLQIEDNSTKKELVSEVVTKEAQKNLTPDEVIKMFKKGNQNFINNNLTQRDHLAQIKHTTKGQYPKAVVLSCIDSRVPIEYIFDQGIGDIFVGRVAGNFVNEDMLGSLEYSCKVAGSKLILVLGHEHCGAIKAAIDNVKLGNITAMLSKIRPVVENTQCEGEHSSSNKDFVHNVTVNNVNNTIQDIRKQSTILKNMEDNGTIKMIGATYDLDTGIVTFLE